MPRRPRMAHTPVHLSSKDHQIISYATQTRGSIQECVAESDFELLWSIEVIRQEKQEKTPLSTKFSSKARS